MQSRFVGGALAECIAPCPRPRLRSADGKFGPGGKTADVFRTYQSQS